MFRLYKWNVNVTICHYYLLFLLIFYQLVISMVFMFLNYNYQYIDVV